MIEANICVKIDFDEDGKKQIESAAETIRGIIDELSKTGGYVGYVIDELKVAEGDLKLMLDGEVW